MIGELEKVDSNHHNPDAYCNDAIFGGSAPKWTFDIAHNPCFPYLIRMTDMREVYPLCGMNATYSLLFQPYNRMKRLQVQSHFLLKQPQVYNCSRESLVNIGEYSIWGIGGAKTACNHYIYGL